jgi:hypothetical protein
MIDGAKEKPRRLIGKVGRKASAVYHDSTIDCAARAAAGYSFTAPVSEDT